MSSGEQERAIAEKAKMAYIANYVVHRLTMPDQNGNLLQPDVTRPEEEVWRARVVAAVCLPLLWRSLLLLLSTG